MLSSVLKKLKETQTKFVLPEHDYPAQLWTESCGNPGRDRIVQLPDIRSSPKVLHENFIGKTIDIEAFKLQDYSMTDPLRGGLMLEEKN